MEIKKNYIEQGVFFILVVFIGYFILGSFFNSSLSLVVIDNPDPNSLYPTYQQGDLFIIRKLAPDAYEVGDVVVYENDRESNIIHRIIDIVQHNGNYYYRVKGDNAISNSTPDNLPSSGTLIPYDRILGKTILRVSLVGHLSLSIQQNTGLRYIVIAIAAITALVIVFYPEDEEEKEDEYIKLSKASFIAALKYPMHKIQQWKEAGKFKTYLIITIVSTALLLAPLIVPVTLYDNEEPIIYDIKAEKGRFVNDTIGSTEFNSYFLQIKVYFEDFGGYFERLESFTIQASTSDTFDQTIGETRWSTMRHIYGTGMIGGSMIIDEDDLPASGTVIYLKITYCVDKLFGNIEKEYQETYTLSY